MGVGWRIYASVNFTTISSYNYQMLARYPANIWTNVVNGLLEFWDKFQLYFNQNTIIFVRQNYSILLSATWCPFFRSINVVKKDWPVVWIRMNEPTIQATQVRFMPFFVCVHHPAHLHGFTSILAWMSNHMLVEMWDAIIHPFPVFNSDGEVWE